MEELRWAVRGKISAEMCISTCGKMEGDTLKALQAKVEKLEKSLRNHERKESEVKTGCGSDNAGQSLYETTALGVCVSSNRSKEAAGEESGAGRQAVSESENFQPPLPEEKATDVRKEGAAPHGVMLPEGKELWAKALEKIKADKKMSLHACASCGNVADFDGKKLTIAFKVAYSCERMKRSDYRKKMEETLLALAQEAVTLIASSGIRPQGTAEDNKALAPTVQKAFEIFGGTIENIKSLFYYVALLVQLIHVIRTKRIHDM